MKIFKTVKLLTLTMLIFSCTDIINNPSKITVSIDYGDLKPLKTVSFETNKETTVLEALQHISMVETRPVNQFVFVTSIDSVKAQRGNMAWYYKINGKPCKSLAIDMIINDVDSIQWVYTNDVCSQKVDCIKKQ